MLPTGLVLTLLVAGSYAIVCTPEICENIEQEELNCEGNVLAGGGFCGCTDVCAGVSISTTIIFY